MAFQFPYRDCARTFNIIDIRFLKSLKNSIVLKIWYFSEMTIHREGAGCYARWQGTCVIFSTQPSDPKILRGLLDAESSLA